MYQYGWLDKVTQITEGDKVIRSFRYHMDGQLRYHMDGQLAAAYDGSNTETFLWDGLALIRRDTTNYLNEPAVTGGNPVIAGEKTLFNDLLGSTLGAKSADGFSAIERDAFGEVKPGETADLGINFFTGKPQVEGLGYTFLFRNYRPDQGKWQTADPLGYPDGWNNLAYVNNGVTTSIDWLGGRSVTISISDVARAWINLYGGSYYTAGLTGKIDVTAYYSVVDTSPTDINVIFSDWSGTTSTSFTINKVNEGGGIIKTYQGQTKDLTQNLVLTSSTVTKNADGTTTLLKVYRATVSITLSVAELGSYTVTEKKNIRVFKTYE